MAKIKLVKDMTATEKLLYKNFGIRNFDDVIIKLQKQPEDIFIDNFYIEKDIFIKKIKDLNKSIISSANVYKDAREMMRSGSIIESFARNHYGAFHTHSMQERKRLIHHLSFFYEKKN